MATDDFFRARLDSMIDMRHRLVVLATRMPWAEIEASLGAVLAHTSLIGQLTPRFGCSQGTYCNRYR